MLHQLKDQISQANMKGHRTQRLVCPKPPSAYFPETSLRANKGELRYYVVSTVDFCEIFTFEIAKSFLDVFTVVNVQERTASLLRELGLQLRNRVVVSTKKATLLVTGDRRMPTPSASSPGRAHQSHHATFGFWAAVACTVNYIVGAGFLSLPAVFAKAGLILSPIIVLMFGVLMDWTKDLMVEALGRAEVVSRCEVITRRHIADQPKESPETIASSSTGDGAVPVPTPSSSASSALVTPKLREYFVFVHRKFEVCCRIGRQ